MIVMMNVMNLDPSSAYSIAILLHASSVAAPLLMFWREFASMISRLPTICQGLREPRDETDRVLRSLIVITIVSATIATPLYFLARGLLSATGGYLVMLLIGVLLAVTGVIQLLPRRIQSLKSIKDLSTLDLVFVGLAQGGSILPGVSRSGLSVTTLLLRRLDKEAALRLSFMVSVPLILGAVILDLAEGGAKIVQSIGVLDATVMLVSTFLASVLSMRALLRVAQKMNFGYFLIIFGSLTLTASLTKILFGL